MNTGRKLEHAKTVMILQIIWDDWSVVTKVLLPQVFTIKWSNTSYKAFRAVSFWQSQFWCTEVGFPQKKEKWPPEMNKGVWFECLMASFVSVM